MNIRDILEEDVRGLQKAQQSYGDSWKKRGGVGAFMMLARKWDRLELLMSKPPVGDIVAHIQADKRAEGALDDVRDLRRYLLLVTTELMAKEEDSPAYFPRTVQTLMDIFAAGYPFMRSQGPKSFWYRLHYLWDCIEFGANTHLWDILDHESNSTMDGHIRNMILYLALVEEACGIVPTHRDNVPDVSELFPPVPSYGIEVGPEPRRYATLTAFEFGQLAEAEKDNWKFDTTLERYVPIVVERVGIDHPAPFGFTPDD